MLKIINFNKSGTMFMSGNNLMHTRLPENVSKDRLHEVLGEGFEGNYALYYKTTPIKISNGVVTCFQKDLMEVKTFVQSTLVEKKVKEDKEAAKADVLINPDITELDLQTDDSDERDEP